jgi:tRNA(adenine34) deaminase
LAPEQITGVPTTGDMMNQSTIDRTMMQRCIALSATAAESGELPFACVICDGDRVVAEAANLVRQERDVTRHAELVALSRAQKVLGRRNLNRCTLYSNVEPCPMCSFPIRETRVKRVVYAIGSPAMGGVSKWNILRDTELSKVMPEAFGPVPEILAGLLGQDAARVWQRSRPLVWAIIKHRGCFAPVTETCDHMQAIPQSHGWIRSLLMLHR